MKQLVDIEIFKSRLFFESTSTKVIDIGSRARSEKS